VGELGTTLTPVHREGKIRVHGEIWNATSKAAIDRDFPVRVVRVDGLRVTVEPNQEDDQ
jgi:membrane-bound ClpP family serine protease